MTESTTPDGLLGELREIPLHGIVQADAALLHKLHGGNRGDGLGHRGKPEQRIELQGASLGNVGHPERALIDDTVAIGGHGDDPGDLLALDGRAQRLVDGRGALCI